MTTRDKDSNLSLPVARLPQERLIEQLQDRVQHLPTYWMEGQMDGMPFSYVLVRRHEVHQLLAACLVAPQEKPDTRCPCRTDVHGRCVYWRGHDGRHVNSMGEYFAVLPPSTQKKHEEDQA